MCGCILHVVDTLAFSSDFLLVTACIHVQSGINVCPLSFDLALNYKVTPTGASARAKGWGSARAKGWG